MFQLASIWLIPVANRYRPVNSHPYQPFKGGQLAAQRNCLILGYLTRPSLGFGCEAGYQGQTQAIDF